MMRCVFTLAMRPQDLTDRLLEKAVAWLRTNRPDVNAAIHEGLVQFDARDGDSERMIAAFIGHLVVGFARDEGMAPAAE
jgi:hypothetical protein